MTAKTIGVSYKDKRNALKLKKAEETGDQPIVTDLLLEDTNEDVFNRLNLKNRP